MSHPAPSQPLGRADASDVTEPARTFQHYEILRREDGSPWELGRGTMGITYKAFDVNLCCEVALKVVNSALLDHPNARERFVREARAAAALRHRNVASVYHLGNDGERFFYAMEFIDGETLDALVRRQGPMPMENALRLILQVARALGAADRQQLVHRDIKPANIMVVHEDDDDHMVVKVIDFGLARPVSGGGTSTGPLTVGGFVGTPQFASPEQLEERALDIRADIYSLGVTAWFLLTGRAPFVGSLATICQQHLTKAPPWEQLPSWLPEPVRRLLGGMLEKDPARRPQNAVELRREIEECLEAVRSRPAVAAKAAPASMPPFEPPSSGDLGNELRIGTMIQGRYELIRQVGDGRRGRTFEGRDTRSDGEVVTITALSPELFASVGQNDGLVDEVRLIQAATHPHLTRVFALERSLRGTPGFLIEEWINGGTLVDLLAARGGVLPVAEGLRLLGQAAAAVDHAASRRLEHLELAIHQVSLHFHAAASVSATHDPREYLVSAMFDWPAWSLKVNPLGAFGEHAELNTWAGEVTLVPGLGSAPDEGTEKRGPDGLATAYLRALAALVYELLGGTPGSWRTDPDSRGKYVSLPALNEAANAVLQQPFAGKTRFGSSRLFYEALAYAAGFDPANLQLAATGQSAAPMPATTPKTPVNRKLPSKPPENVADSSRETFFPTRRAGGATTVQPASGSTTPFFMRGEAGFDVPVEDDYSPGSISDRLTLVGGEPSPVGRWLIGTAALLLVFVFVVAGVWILLAQRLPREESQPAMKTAPATPTAAPDHEPRHRATNSPRPSTPPPLPAESVRSSSPSTTARAADGSSESPRVSAATPSTTLPDIVPATPAIATPAPEELITVRVKSIPNGATIQSGGKTLGTTPLDVELPPGAHELVARFDGWPETRETLILGYDQPAATTEIHLMPPALVPASDMPPPSEQIRRPRRTLPAPLRAPITHATPGVGPRSIPVAPAIPVVPSTDSAASATTPAPEASAEPEVRRALPPLTPFDPDGPTETHATAKKMLPEPSPSAE